MSTRAKEHEESTNHDHEYMELCLSINIDKSTLKQAVQNFQVTSANYALEGDSLHWFACALYIKSHENVQIAGDGNFVSLNKLLKASSLSFVSFMQKVERWLDMNPDVNAGFREKVNSLERRFYTTTLVFKKFVPLFQKMFLNPFSHHHSTSTRLKKFQCSSNDIFKFCWTVFIQAKATQYREISEDVGGLFQLLLSAMNFCFANALRCEHRTSLLNPSFLLLPADWNKPDFKYPQSPPIISNYLAQYIEGFEWLQAENCVLSYHKFILHVKSIFCTEGGTGIMNGDANSMTSFFIPSNFEKCRTSIDASYDKSILAGDLDERVFFSEDAEEKLGIAIKQKSVATLPSFTIIPDSFSVGKSAVNLKLKSLLADTMHTGSSVISEPGQSVAKLQLLLRGQPLDFSDAFVKDVLHDSSEITAKIAKRLEELGSKFLTAYCGSYNGQIGHNNTILCLMKALYYKSLESIIWQEKKRVEARENGGSCEQLLSRDDFHALLFGCCAEVVLFSYHSSRVFPWILDALEFKAYYFYKVIELLIRAEENLSRDVVKHLIRIEEEILETMAWETGSPLWEAIANVSNVPSCEEVCCLQQIASASIKVHPRVQEIADQANAQTNIGKSDISVLTNTMAHDRFSSPMPGSIKGSFQDGNGHSVTSQNQPSAKPKRTGSLALFFRKVYHITWNRIKDMCDKLVISTSLQAKVWTTLEQTLVRYPTVMKDRHIDQLIMCAVYVISKFNDVAHHRSFQEIVRCYRTQPQARSQVYRKIPIKNTNEEEKKGDLIQFYNKDFLPCVKDFVKAFGISSSGATDMKAPQLSPLPTSRPMSRSPKRVHSCYQIYISPREKPDDASMTSNSPALEYSFQQSPSNNFQKFNEMFSRHTATKRNCRFDLQHEVDHFPRPKNHAITYKLRKVQDDRNKFH